ncbi:MAG: acetyl-CoA carboxylase, biotin carboxyl carrier protein [Lentisphaerae bacterium RIFOXYB12_FULL_65_16]|nr:MAG: acetyl-CoA carboxylase, biotin carboxyl carrier protein [Lentisphaerae bacterium RIFOXYA12_64_32]OGV87086.1 MAG: acetyl-CoA carboxylase, biotin carboxyl carrier protein [Lentisphaerae bacterium RIFOXYB12_FULL_65_16]
MVRPVADEDRLHKIPLRVTDVTLRDAHQSLWATRMRTEDIEKIIDVIDKVGYYSLEVWGGATFDVCLRFLRENPWERLRLVKAKARNTPLQMLLRGQNLVGYRNYPDDLVDRFVALACENGVDIFRCFDALNDPRNLEAAIKAVKKYGGHAQGTLSYTISPVHTVEKYVDAAKAQLALGIDSLCIKDMAGILSPIMAERLVTALVNVLNIPIQLHCHASSGMAVPSYVEGVRAGAGAIDCAISSMSGFSSLPPVETLLAIFSETHYSAKLDIDALGKVNKYFKDLYPRRALAPQALGYIDPDVLLHQIPGGMISNFRSQLEMQNALPRLPEVLTEVSEVRKDLGYPPLVTPTSQIVGTQAVMNVLAGERYKIVPNEVKDYVRGLYGRSPESMAPGFVRQILGEEKPIDHRPADDIQPMLAKAAQELDPKLVENEEDIVSYCMLPEVALEYFKWRALPKDQRPPTPHELELKKLADSKKTKDDKKPETKKEEPLGPILQPDDYKGIGDILSKAGKLSIEELSIRKGDLALTFRAAGAKGILASRDSAAAPTATSSPAGKADLPANQTAASSAARLAKAEPQAVAPAYEKAISAPFVGTFYASSGPGKPPFVEAGKTVEPGQTVCVVEAMKLFNEIKAPTKCKIVQILIADGQKVEKGQALIAIEDV